MNLWRLECFVVLAQELHFGRAAQRLHVSQPALSQQIKLLEESLGVSLVNRTGITALTPAGETLLPDAEAVLSLVDEMVAKVTTADGKLGGVLRVLYARSIPVTESFHIVESFRKLHSGVTIDSQTMWTSWNVDALKAGTADVAFVRLPVSDPAIRTFRLGGNPQFLAMPTTHPLATNEEVTRDEIADLPFVHWSRRDAPGNFDVVFSSIVREPGFEVSATQPDLRHRLAVVADGGGVALIHDFTVDDLPNTVVARPIVPAVLSEYGIAWNANTTDTITKRFVAIVKGL